MATFIILALAVVFSAVQGLPVETQSSSSSSSTGLHLIVKNATDASNATNYHLTPFMNEMEKIDDTISADLEEILPYINFLFDTLLNRPNNDDGCIDDMVIQLVPEKVAPTENQEPIDATPVEDSDAVDIDDDDDDADDVKA